MRKEQSVPWNDTDRRAESQEESGATVQSVTRALDLFAAVVRAEGATGVSELAAVAGLPVTTAHRLLGALGARGFIQHDREARRYAVGPVAVELGAVIRGRNGLPDLAAPFLQELVDLTGESANLAVLDGTAAVYVAHVASPRTVRMFTEAGNRAPLHASGTGKVLLANLPDDRREALLDGLVLERHTRHTIVTRDGLRRELDRVRDGGAALDNGEFEDGVSCVAVPVRDRGDRGDRGGRGDRPDRVVAAISVSGPASRLTRERALELLPQIKAISARLSASLLPGDRG